MYAKKLLFLIFIINIKNIYSYELIEDGKKFNIREIYT